MKLTIKQLRKIIKEELDFLSEIDTLDETMDEELEEAANHPDWDKSDMYKKGKKHGFYGAKEMDPKIYKHPDYIEGYKTGEMKKQGLLEIYNGEKK